MQHSRIPFPYLASLSLNWNNAEQSHDGVALATLQLKLTQISHERKPKGFAALFSLLRDPLTIHAPSSTGSFKNARSVGGLFPSGAGYVCSITLSKHGDVACTILTLKTPGFNPK